jgi:Tol biopolymer transport system component
MHFPGRTHFSFPLSLAQMVLASTLLGCAGDTVIEPPPPVPVASVAVSPSPLLLAEGQTGNLSAVPRDANGIPLAGRSVQWSSLNEDVAAVSLSGIVTARAEGVTTIRATSEGKAGDVTVTVLPVAPPPGEVASVTLDASEVSVEEGSERQLTATPRDASGTPIAGLGMQWTSSDATIASVDALGGITAIRPGSATITVRVHGKTASAVVSVFAEFGYNMLYSAYADGGLQLFETDIRQAGTPRTALLPADTWVSNARPSPDGSRIAFLASIDGVQGLYVMDRNGSNVRLLMGRELGPVLNPSWSPDGTRIAYQTGGGQSSQTLYDIWTVDAVTGGNRQNLTGDMGFADQLTPAWSPQFASGSSRIAFAHRANGVERIWTMRADGTDKREITAGVLDEQPSWSPDGQTIVFTRTNAIINADIHLVDANGNNVRTVMSFYSLAGAQMNPVFTPDGRMIAFSSQHATYGTGNGESEVYTIWLDGTKLARRTTGGGLWPAFLMR